MQHLTTFWRRSLLNKLIIVAVPFCFCCIPLRAATNQASVSPTSIPTQATNIESTAVVIAPTETAIPEPGAIPRSTPRPTSSPAPEPTAAPSADQILEEQVRNANPPVRRGAVSIEHGDFGNGPRISITMPIGDQGTNEQIVRLGKLRMTNAILAAFDSDPAIVEVNVIGTTPLGGTEAAAISIVILRSEMVGWSGKSEDLPNWQVSQRLGN